MVKTKKKSRAVSRAKPVKPEPDPDEQENEFDKEQLLKRLDDFDMQSEMIKSNMEAEKQSIIESVEHLFFIDEQRTSADINNMLWLDFLNLNSCEPKSKIRLSIAALIDKTEQRPKRKKAGATTVKKPVKTIAYESTPALRSSKRGKQFMDVACTPQNQNIPAMDMLITPKFDPRLPVPQNTTRMPRFGEIAVSFAGSPIQTDTKNFKIENLTKDEVEELSKEKLKLLQQQISNLLK